MDESPPCLLDIRSLKKILDKVATEDEQKKTSAHPFAFKSGEKKLRSLTVKMEESKSSESDSGDRGHPQVSALCGCQLERIGRLSEQRTGCLALSRCQMQ